jgi:nucleoside-diphosphate-sugar epimerase
LYASDLMIWLWKILIKGESNSPYNVGSDESISIKDLAEKIKDVSNSTVSIKILGTPIQKEDIDIYCPYVNKANLINVSVKIQLNESINKTIKFNESTWA